MMQKIGPFPIVNGPEGLGLQMDVNPHFLAFVAFDEGATQNMHVGVVLGGMLKYVNDAVLPRFAPFF